MEKTRSRLINFRVTDEEFEQLKRACNREGARCMSDFARTIMLNRLNLAPQSLVDQLLSLERRVLGLETSLARLAGAPPGWNGKVAGSET